MDQWKATNMRRPNFGQTNEGKIDSDSPKKSWREHLHPTDTYLSTYINSYTNKWGFYQSNSDDASNNHKSIRELREQEWDANIQQIICSLERGTTYGQKRADHYGHDYNECMEGIKGMIMENDQPTWAPHDYSYPTHSFAHSNMDVGIQWQAESNANQWPCHDEMSNMSSLGNEASNNWQDGFDMGNFYLQEFTQGGSYDYPSQDISYGPHSSPWSYAPNDSPPPEWSYEPPPPPEGSLEDTLARFITFTQNTMQSIQNNAQSMERLRTSISQTALQMKKVNDTLGSENEFQHDDPSLIETPLDMDCANMQRVSKGALDDMDYGALHESDYATYEPNSFEPHQSDLKEDVDSLEENTVPFHVDPYCGSDSFKSFGIADFLETDFPMIDGTANAPNETQMQDYYWEDDPIFQISDSDNLESLESCTEFFMKSNDPTLREIAIAFLGPQSKSEKLLELQECGPIQTFKSDTLESFEPVPMDIVEINSKAFVAREVMWPPSCSLRPPILPFKDPFLREEEVLFMVVLFPRIYNKHHAVLMFNVLHVPVVTFLSVLLVNCVEENFIWDPGGFMVLDQVV